MTSVPVPLRRRLRRLARRLTIGLFLDVWPPWATVSLLAAGLVALACRLFVPAAAPYLSWLWLAPLAAAVPEHVFAMNQRMGLPLRLRELGVPRDGLRQLASDALDDYSIHTNPKPVTAAEQVLEVLEQAW